MPGVRLVTLTEPVAGDLASWLRHDLITPINLIVGYCDLLIDETGDSDLAQYRESFESIRTLGFDSMRGIDRVLLRDQSAVQGGDVREMAIALAIRARDVVAACEQLDEAILDRDDPALALDDLAKIRMAAIRLVEMAVNLASGRFALEPPDRLRSESPSR